MPRYVPWSTCMHEYEWLLNADTSWCAEFCVVSRRSPKQCRREIAITAVLRGAMLHLEHTIVQAIAADSLREQSLQIFSGALLALRQDQVRGSGRRTTGTWRKLLSVMRVMTSTTLCWGDTVMSLLWGVIMSLTGSSDELFPSTTTFVK